MIYVQQQIRSRKDSLVPIRQNDNDVKIEIVDVSTLNGMELFSLDSDQFIEVVASPGSPSSCTSSSTSSNSNEMTSRPRKRAKLDHLSQEEKAQHRKMMNRISAQSARDRQKLYITQQDKALKKLASDNESLAEQNKTLTDQNEKLTTENQSLKSMIEDLENQLKKMSSSLSSSSSSIPSIPLDTVKIKMEHPTFHEQETTECCSSPKPAVLFPLPKELELQQTIAFLLLMWTLSLLNLQNPQKLTLTNLQHFLYKSSVKKISSPILSRSCPQKLASEKRDRTALKNWGLMKADLPG